MRRSTPRTLVRVAAVGGTLLSAACGKLPTAPSDPATPSAAKLAPSSPSSAGRSGYMLSSGLVDTEVTHTK